MAGGDFVSPTKTFDHAVGVDRGALRLIENEWHLDLAVGDFDSVTPDERVKIAAASDKVVKLPPEKDDTDLEVALKLALEFFPSEQIVIMGALGGRLDHWLTNLYLPTTKDFRAFSKQISLVDAQNVVRYFPAGEYELSPIDHKQYIGFVQLNTKNFEINNAKYPLMPEKNDKQIYASNEFINGKIKIKIEAGMLIVIYSSDSKNKSY